MDYESSLDSDLTLIKSCLLFKSIDYIILFPFSFRDLWYGDRLYHNITPEPHDQHQRNWTVQEDPCDTVSREGELQKVQLTMESDSSAWTVNQVYD
jgi:hypothetical protein